MLFRSYKATVNLVGGESNAELDRLDCAGVVGARLNIARQFGVTPTHEATLRVIHRVRELGWHVRLHVRHHDLLDFSDLLKKVEGVDMVIDHLGHVDLSLGLDNPVVRWILEMLKRENWWMMASNGNRDSALESGWDDAVPVARAYIEAAPERIV